MTGLVEGSLATMRLARLIREDTITDPARTWFFKRFPTNLEMSVGRHQPKGKGWEPIVKFDDEGDSFPERWYRQPKIGPFARQLLGCPTWCLGVWAAGMIAVASRVPLVGRILVRTLALAAVHAVFYDEIIPLGVHVPREDRDQWLRAAIDKTRK
jgi:hypothetical protein